MFSDEQIAHFIDTGILEIIGQDVDGDDIIVITDKAQGVVPELFTFRQDFLGIAAMELWEQDFLNIYVEDDQFKVELTDKSYSPQLVSELSVGSQTCLLQFRHILEKNGNTSR